MDQEKKSERRKNEYGHGREITSCADLMECIDNVGFLPLLESGIAGYSADAMMAPDCRYRVLPDGGWEWPLWRWKGPAVTEGNCVYGKFFASKAGFVSREWWPDFCNWRRHANPMRSTGSDEGAIGEAILAALHEGGSMVSRDLRTACGMVGPKMRSRFDAYVSRLQMACRIVTEDFVYPLDKQGNEYGWGLSLFTTPEQLLGHEAMFCDRSPEKSLQRMVDHMQRLLPQASEKQIRKLIK